MSPRSHDQAVVAFATLNLLDTPSFIQLRAEDHRAAAIVMARGSLASARNPSAAITARYPAARALVAALNRAQAATSDRSARAVAAPAADVRREGVLHRAVRDATPAAVKASLISHPDSALDTDRQRRTALHLAADAGLPTIAVYLLDARADANARDRQGFTPVDCAEYWATRAARRAPECLATLAVLLCHSGKRSRSEDVADPENVAVVHQRLAEAHAAPP